MALLSFFLFTGYNTAILQILPSLQVSQDHLMATYIVLLTLGIVPIANYGHHPCYNWCQEWDGIRNRKIEKQMEQQLLQCPTSHLQEEESLDSQDQSEEESRLQSPIEQLATRDSSTY